MRGSTGTASAFLFAALFLTHPACAAEAPLELAGHEGWVTSAQFSPDGARLVSGGEDGAVKVWDARDGKELWSSRDEKAAVMAAAFSADGHRVAAGRWDGTVVIHAAKDGAVQVTLRGHTESVAAVAFSPDGKRLASGSGDDTLRLWDARSGKLVRTFEQGNEYDVTAVAFSPDGNRIVSGDGENAVRIWDADKGEPLPALEGHEAVVSSVAFSADGTRIVSESWDRTVMIWNAADGRPLATLRGHTDEVTSVAVNSNAIRVASGGADGTVKIWDARDGTALWSCSGGMEKITSVAFSPDGKSVAASGKGAVKVWTLPGATRPRLPNLIFILADDLGYGDLGCFGQKQLKTPRLDAMAAGGMRFTQFYAGGPVCAPSRCVLLTGRHVGRATVRGNSIEPIILKPGQPTVASLLKDAGYATACVGKWGVGTPHDLTNPNDAGFVHFFGYVNMWHAHNFYPEFLIRNGKVEKLRNVVAEKWKPMQDPAHPQAGRGVAEQRVDYAPELLTADALRFIREHKDRPFFLYFTPNTPHANNEAGDAGMEAPEHGEFADKDWPAPEMGFAAMLRNLDRDTGRILDALEELGIARDTLVLFTSDNGPHNEGGHHADFFDSNGKFRGSKRDLAEGGIRVPAIAWWPGVIAPGGTNDHQWYVGDLMATAAELAGRPRPADIDSDSLVPTLRGNPPAQQWDRKSVLYWECYEGRTAQAVRFGKWKAVRSPMFTGPIQLYDLSNDFEEKRDYAPRRADLLKHAGNLLNKHHHPDPNWKLKDPESAE